MHKKQNYTVSVQNLTKIHDFLITTAEHLLKPDVMESKSGMGMPSMTSPPETKTDPGLSRRL
jgi:hypothetical protein